METRCVYCEVESEYLSTGRSVNIAKSQQQLFGKSYSSVAHALGQDRLSGQSPTPPHPSKKADTVRPLLPYSSHRTAEASSLFRTFAKISHPVSPCLSACNETRNAELTSTKGDAKQAFS